MQVSLGMGAINSLWVLLMTVIVISGANRDGDNKELFDAMSIFYSPDLMNSAMVVLLVIMVGFIAFCVYFYRKCKKASVEERHIDMQELYGTF